MEKKLDCYTFICDNCEVEAFKEDEHICWIGEDIAWERASEVGWIKHNNGHYCEDCWCYDDNDNIVFNSDRSVHNPPTP